MKDDGSKELLQQVRVLDPVSHSDRIADVLIEEGIVTAIAESLTVDPETTRIQDCRDLVLAPGLVDLYSRSGEPGFEERETLASLGRAATAGGFTRLTLLPNTKPTLDHPASIAWMHEHWRVTAGHSQLNCWAALTVNTDGQHMTELAELSTAGIAGFADGKPIQNLLLVRRILEYLKPLGLPVALWACDRELASGGVMREGHNSLLFGLPGIPAIAETTALAALLECVEDIGTPVHLMRISTARGVDLIQAAKARGLPVTASTSWMHLLLNTEAIHRYDSSLKLEPPLGNPVDQAALKYAVQQGIIDAIAIDHRPYTYEEKTVAFAEAPWGAIGLDFALPLLWQELVATGDWTALNLWTALSLRPAQCLHQVPPQLVIGQPAELVLFNPAQPWLVEARSLQSLSANTPWLQQTITGQVIRTWCP